MGHETGGLATKPLCASRNAKSLICGRVARTREAAIDLAHGVLAAMLPGFGVQAETLHAARFDDDPRASPGDPQNRDNDDPQVNRDNDGPQVNCDNDDPQVNQGDPPNHPDRKIAVLRNLQFPRTVDHLNLVDESRTIVVLPNPGNVPSSKSLTVVTLTSHKTSRTAADACADFPTTPITVLAATSRPE